MDEAIAVARDLADSLDDRIGIVAGLMGISSEAARSSWLASSASSERPLIGSGRGQDSRGGGFVVERRVSRSAAGRLQRRAG